MEWHTLLFIVLLVSVFGCTDRKKENQIKEWQAALIEKEQELNLRERTLQLKEQELLQQEQKIDSAQKADSTAVSDTAHAYNPAIIGMWSVKMTCTEATCPGSAVGDTKTEQWDIYYVSNQIIAKAMAGEQLVRLYTGTFTDNTVELVGDRDSTASQPGSKMMVRLRLINETSMEGQREIVRENKCKVVYDLNMDKQ